MGATYQRRGKRSWLITVHSDGQRERRTIHGTEHDARDLVRFIYKQELAGVNVVETVRTARPAAAPAPAWPRLRDDVPAFIAYQVSVGEWTGETPISYRRSLGVHAFNFTLADGRLLGDLPVDAITPVMLGAVLDAIRRSRKSLALQERVRSPLRAYYRHLIKRQGFTGRSLSSRRAPRSSGRAKPPTRGGCPSWGSARWPACAGGKRPPFSGTTSTPRSGKFTSSARCVMRRARSRP
jgi:hypothetical protein